LESTSDKARGDIIVAMLDLHTVARTRNGAASFKDRRARCTTRRV